jgi:coenzyme F420-reducing hydrogenase delta subunit
LGEGEKIGRRIDSRLVFWRKRKLNTPTNFKPKIIGFLCNWCCYGGADLCGVSRLQYPPHIRVIRVMCAGRVDPAFVLRAFKRGMDGVFIGGCHFNDCHYNTEGNYDAFSMVQVMKRLLEHTALIRKVED